MEDIDDCKAPIMNWERLNLTTEGDEAFERELLTELISSGERAFAAMRGAIDSRDAAELRREAHSLKGSARTLGAERLGIALQRLELCAASGDLASASPLLEAASEACAQVWPVVEERLRKKAA